MVTQTERGSGQRAASAFDIRLIIAALFAIYGVVLTVMGLVATSGADLARAAGSNVNLWAGIGMLVFTVVLAAWAWLRPIVVPPEVASSQTSTPETPDAE